MAGELSIKSHPAPLCSDIFLGEPNGAGSISKNVFIIPPYQRAYTWSRDEWSDLYDDLIDSDSSMRDHFIGTFMFIRSEGDQIVHQVVDGQQRLTTISLLYLALGQIGLEKLHQYKKEEQPKIKESSKNDEEMFDRIGNFTSNFSEMKNNLLAVTFDNVFVSGYKQNNENRPKLKLTLSHCSKNNSDYQRLAIDICEYYLNIDNQTEEFKSKSDKRRMIRRAHTYFHTKLSDEIKEKFTSPKEAYDYVLELAQKLSSWQTIIIKTENEAQAYVLFDSLNNRGVPLSPVDIVKNTLFAKMAEFDVDIDEEHELWVDLIERIDSEKYLRRFFVDFYNIYYKDYGCTRLNPITENDIIKRYSDLIKEFKSKNEILRLYNHLLEISEIYSLIIHPENINPDDYGYGDSSEFKYSLIHLNKISAVPCYGFLTFLYDKLELKTHKDDVSLKKSFTLFTDVVKMLTKFFAIRHITDVPRVKFLPLLFDKWLQQYIGAKPAEKLDHYRNSFIAVIKDDKKNRFSIEPKSIIQDKLEKLEYEAQDGRTALIRYLFTIYEMNSSTSNPNSKSAYKKLWERNTETNIGEFKYSIEHIIPEGKTIAEKHRKYWESVLGDDFGKRSEFMNTLGNLALLEPNKQAAQRPFVNVENEEEGL